MKSDSTTEITKALIGFQGELQPVHKTSVNPFFKSKYADLSAIWECIRGQLQKHELAVSQLPHVSENQIVLTTLLLHTSGEWLSSDLLVTPGKPNDPQAVGSALTYARRYALSAILGICSEEDDDAESAVVRVPKTEKPKKPDLVDEAKKLGGVESIANAGDFLTKALKEHGLNKTEVERHVGKVSELSDFMGAWELLEKSLQPKK